MGFELVLFRWPPLRLARVCFEHVSVCVVLSAVLPWEIARILEAHVAEVIVVSPADTGIRQARAKTDRLDARTLARLLAAGELDAVWAPDEWTRVMRRRLSRREQLVRSRSRAKNEIHAVLMRRLKGRPPVSDLFGVKGRRWLGGLEFPVEEQAIPYPNYVPKFASKPLTFIGQSESFLTGG